MIDTIQKHSTGKARFEATFEKLFAFEMPEQSFYYCSPVFIAPDGTKTTGDAYLNAGGKERVLDQAVLSRNTVGTVRLVADFLQDCQAKGETAKVVLPINVVALTIESIASDFTASCRDLLTPYISQITIEMTNFPAKFSIEYLDYLGILVYPFCQQYIARPDPSWTDFKIFTNCNFQGVSFDLKNKDWEVGQIKSHLEKFCESAEAYRLVPYLLGAATSEIKGVAFDLGFKFIAGDAII